MRLAAKFQLAYLTLLVIPFLIGMTLIVTTYYIDANSLGPYQHLDAPGWIKRELAAIFDEDWEAFEKLPEPVVLFIRDSDGFLTYPNLLAEGGPPENYPFPGVHGKEGISPPLSQSSGPGDFPQQFTEAFAHYGIEWTLDISIMPVEVKGQMHLVGWRKPRQGLPGFIAKRGWLPPILILTGIMLIPAFFDRGLRKSIQRLQKAIKGLSSGHLDKPIIASSRDDLADVADALDKTRIELKESRDRKARFLMAVSHDLRTPLTSIKGYIEAISDGMAESPEDLKRYIAVLGEKATLLEGRVGELIEFARLDSAGWVQKGTEINAGELMNRLDAAFQKDCGFAHRPYKSRLRIPETAVIKGDADALYRAWENLFANALRHNEAVPIRFNADTSTEYGLVNDPLDAAREGEATPRLFLTGEIIDEGTGIDTEFLPRLFEPFSRVDRGRNSQGLGLGLASVKAVAEAHGGAADYRPGNHGGSIFRIRIPLKTL